jgi:cell wall-associated NlpC family hydrolase
MLYCQMISGVLFFFSALLAHNGVPTSIDFNASTAVTITPLDTSKVALDSASLKNQPGMIRAELIDFAKTLKGIRYKYASADPKKGFDCSGFVMYVFKHFQISVPRSSIDFTRVGNTIELPLAQPGDVILFTGSNSKVRRVGHVGIITQGGENITFIHASSGKTYSVTETTLNEHYKKRFVKVVRVLEQ